MRIVHVANDVEALHRIGGVDAAVEMLRARRGTEFDPALVDRFCAHADELLAALDELDGWDALIGGRAALERELGDDELDEVLEAFADYADVKSPFTLGHSRGVAAAGRGGGRRRRPARSDDVALVAPGRARHDVGTIGVSAGILDKPGRLTDGRAGADPHPPVPHRPHVLEAAARLAAIGAARRAAPRAARRLRATRRASPPTRSR